MYGYGYRYNSGLVIGAGGGKGASYLVDDFAPYIAYDLRKISSTATNSIRVRRLSDNAEQDIGFNGDALDESALATFCSGTDGFVTTFYDQSGNSLNAVMVTASSQPRICLNGVIDSVNGKPAILGDGVNDSLRVASLVGSLPNTQFALYDKVGTSGYFGSYGLTSSITGFGLGATGSRIYQNGAAFSPFSSLNTQALLMMKSTELTTSDWKFYENGNVIINNGEAIGTLAYNRVSLFDRPNNASRCNMYLQTYLLFNSDESITNRVAIQDNINTYYSIY
tara:strand:+ start:319 stop:1158 length:840 start_codon:yes stop_codon:yes gene_type:complete